MPSWSKLLGECLDRVPGGPCLLGRVAGARDSAAAPIFMFHRVLPDPAEAYHPEMAVSVEAMEAFLAWLVEHYDVRPLDDLPAALVPGRQQAACALTFDDGWLDTFAHAFPLLQRWRVPATVFLPVHFIGTDRRFWQEKLHFHLRRLRNDERGWAKLNEVGRSFAWCPQLSRADLDDGRLRRRLLQRSSEEAEVLVDRLGEAAGLSLELVGRVFMNWDEVRAMQRAGVGFGSHTLDHTLLSSAAPGASAHALQQSQIALSQQLDGGVAGLAYPWGEPGPFGRTQAQAAGYRWAVTTRPGLVRADSDPWLWPRMAVSDAQLGWSTTTRARERGRNWRPATLQMHLARARSPVPPAANLLNADNRLRLGMLVDPAQPWGDAAPALRGGSELQFQHMLQALDGRYFDVELYFLHRPPGGLPARTPWPCYSAAPEGVGRWQTIRCLRNLLRARQPALVQAMFQDGLFLGVPAAWWAGVPAILCSRRNAGHWKRRHHEAALRAINRMATAWQTNSAAVATMLAASEGLDPLRIEILPNALDLDRLRPAGPAERRRARAQLGVPPEAFLVASVANLTPVKDLPTLVRAAARIGEVADMQFLLIGDGDEPDTLKALISALGIGSRLRLEGPRQDVGLCLTAADAGVLTSRSEGCSNAVLEYMAAGLPTVLSDIPANRMLVREGLFPVGDAAALAHELLALARDPELRLARGRANRRTAEAFGGDYAERVRAHYVRAMRHCRPPSRSVPSPGAAPPLASQPSAAVLPQRQD